MVKNGTKNKRFSRADRVLAVLAIITIVAAWLFGYFKAESSLIPHFKKVIPQAGYFEQITGNVYSAKAGKNTGNILGYIAVATGNGYGGTMKLAAAADSSGIITGFTIVEQRETFSFLRRVLKSDLLKSLTGKSFSSSFKHGEDIEFVTGATYTSKALVNSVKQAIRETSKVLGFSVPDEPPPKIKFGLPEIILILLYTAGFIGLRKKTGSVKIIRWSSMLTGMLVLGFLYTIPLTLVFINKMLMGFWPEWQTHLYWYMLIGGILFFFIIEGRNPYCEWFCPFGSVQECFGAVGGAKARRPEKYKDFLKWLQRGIALSAIVFALLYRNPGISSYEVFGTMFMLVGSNYIFILLGLVLVTSIFIKRPWCSYLCPLRPVTDFIRLLRNWVIELWKSHHPEKAV
ncbi:4Fe-4S binding protein [candidate division KSB1 bacterium]